MAASGNALSGVKILDLSRVLAGPWATQLLADLGADVIKVEKPGSGDDTRSWGPPWFGDEDGAREAAYFVAANRGKRSILADIGTPEGAALVTRLAARSDVLVENFKVGGLARYGLDYASLARINPRLIYCSISGFGQSGPYADRPGYDFIVQAMGGLMSVTGTEHGPPMKAGVALTDILTGLYASNGILAALHQREKTGEGQHIDVALLDVQVATLANQASNYLATGHNPRRRGNAHPNIVPYQSFATSDGDIAVAAGNDAQFQRLCELIERPDLAVDSRYATNAARVAMREDLIPMLASRFALKPSAHWLEQLAAGGVPAGPVNTLSDVFADPQVRHRELAIDMPHAGLGHVRGVACPLRLSRSSSSARRGPPLLGEHHAEILDELAAEDEAAAT
jgi:crotonobetainyl-CoA:carnitine CoA-transferase CaiB-like acyl-CoA transferase